MLAPWIKSWSWKCSHVIKLQDPDQPPVCYHMNRWATSSSVPVLLSHKACSPKPLKAVFHHYEGAIKNTLRVSMVRCENRPFSQRLYCQHWFWICPTVIVNGGEGLRLRVIHHIHFSFLLSQLKTPNNKWKVFYGRAYWPMPCWKWCVIGNIIERLI